MGKRQKRIFQHQLEQQKSAWLGKEACVVTSDARTLRGVLKELAGGQLVVLDMRQLRQLIPVKDVTEIVLDFEADY